MEARCNFVVISHAKPQELKNYANKRNWTFSWYSCFQDISFAKDYDLVDIKTGSHHPSIMAFHMESEQSESCPDADEKNGGNDTSEKSVNQSEETGNNSNGIQAAACTGTIYNTWITSRKAERTMDFGTIVWNFFDIIPSGRGEFLPKGDYSLN